MNDLVTIRMDVEGMRQSVVHAFSQHNFELEKKVNDQLQRALENFRWDLVIEDTVQRVVRASIEKAISDFFTHREGRKIIDRMVYQSFIRPDAIPRTPDDPRGGH